MIIAVDGQEREVPEGLNLAEVLELLGEATDGALVEVNGRLVPGNQYEATRLNPGDQVEVIYPAFGG